MFIDMLILPDSSIRVNMDVVKRELVMVPGPEECASDPLECPLSEAEAVPIAKAFAALSDPARLRLYTLIASQPGQVCACSLVEPVGRSQPTVSHHLKVLFEAGLIDKQRRGSWIWYWTVPGEIDRVVAALQANTRTTAGS